MNICFVYFVRCFCTCFPFRAKTNTYIFGIFFVTCLTSFLISKNAILLPFIVIPSLLAIVSMILMERMIDNKDNRIEDVGTLLLFPLRDSYESKLLAGLFKRHSFNTVEVAVGEWVQSFPKENDLFINFSKLALKSLKNKQMYFSIERVPSSKTFPVHVREFLKLLSKQNKVIDLDKMNNAPTTTHVVFDILSRKKALFHYEEYALASDLVAQTTLKKVDTLCTYYLRDFGGSMITLLANFHSDSLPLLFKNEPENLIGLLETKSGIDFFCHYAKKTPLELLKIPNLTLKQRHTLLDCMR